MSVSPALAQYIEGDRPGAAVRTNREGRPIQRRNNTPSQTPTPGTRNAQRLADRARRREQGPPPRRTTPRSNVRTGDAPTAPVGRRTATTRTQSPRRQAAPTPPPAPTPARRARANARRAATVPVAPPQRRRAAAAPGNPPTRRRRNGS